MLLTTIRMYDGTLIYIWSVVVRLFPWLFLSYPSGRPALFYLAAGIKRSGFYTIAYEDGLDSKMLACFTSNGRGCCYHSNGVVRYVKNLNFIIIAYIYSIWNVVVFQAFHKTGNLCYLLSGWKSFHDVKYLIIWNKYWGLIVPSWLSG